MFYKIKGVLSSDLIDKYPIINELYEGLVLKTDKEEKYSVNENKILFTGIGYDEENDEEYTYEYSFSYVINVNKMLMSQEKVDEIKEKKHTIELIKVSDSAVAGARSDCDESNFPPFL